MDVLLLILSREFEKFRPDLHEKRVRFQGSTKRDKLIREVGRLNLLKSCQESAVLLFLISEIPGYEDARPLFAKICSSNGGTRTNVPRN